MERVILHSHMNNCYASIEFLYRPELRKNLWLLERYRSKVLNCIGKRSDCKKGRSKDGNGIVAGSASVSGYCI